MRRFPSLLALTLLPLVGCLEGSTSGGAIEQVPAVPEAGSRMADSLPQDFAPVAPSSVPQILYLEQVAVFAEREVHLWDDDSQTAMREELRSDGEGNSRLDVTGYRATHDSDWEEPSPTTEMMYELRGPFLMGFRDLHLGHPHAYGMNYEWFVDAKPHEVAGHRCLKWSARSIHGYGGADLLIEESTGLLLGWTVLGADLKPRTSLTTTRLELNPEFAADISWQRRDEVVLDAYNSDVHPARLGFTPKAPLYLPPGFYLESEHVASDGSGLEVYISQFHDGLLPLFVAERTVASMTDHESDQIIIDKVRRSRFGGMELVEGAHRGLEIYVIGGLPGEELYTVFGSMID